MRLQEIGAAISKRWWIIVGLVLISALIAAVIAQVQSPVYKAEVKMAAQPPENPTTKLPDATIAGAYNVGGILFSIANATESIGVAETVSVRLQASGIDIPPEELLDKASATPEANSTSITLTFTDGSPTRVAEIANTWGEVLELKTISPEEGLEESIYDKEFKDILLGGTLVITNEAQVPDSPTMPKPLIYVGLGAFLGLVLGLCLVIGIEYFNPRFRSPQEAEETMGLPVLGMLPKERGTKSSALLPTFGEGSMTWLAYSELRGSIILSQEDESSKSILAISAMPFEAGPGIAANLAVSIAYTGRKTLLVDCDLAGRAVSRLMDAESKPGLSDALERGDEAWDEITGTEFENLSFLPAGKPSRISAELLSLPLFEEILQGLEAQYKKVVIYAPPLAISIDGPVVASKARVTYFVLDVDKTSRKVALEAMSGFDRVNVKPAGLVLANVKVKGKERARLSTKAAPAKKKEKRESVTTATVAAEGTAPAEKAKKKRRQRPVKKKEEAKRKAAAAPEPKPYFTPSKTTAVKGTPKKTVEKAVEKPGGKKAEPAIPKKPAEELKQMKEIVADDFSRMGKTGAPIPKEWLRALNSDKADVRESATKAITAYYNAFLRRYSISDESIGLITESIIRMMRREGEFAHMNEKEAQQYLQEMLVDAGAKFSGSPSSGPSGTGEHRAKSNITTTEPKADKESSREEQEQLERETKEDAKAGEGKDDKTSQLLETEPQPEKESGIDWE